MLFRFSAIILTACSVLFAGCRASHTAKAAPPERTLAHSVALNHLPTDGMTESDATLAPLADQASWNTNVESAIDAHAHYAAGVVHEMNLEPESALEDYFKAAMLDPTNEGLVLDVSQQFLQAKEPEKALSLLSHASTNSAVSGALFAEMGFVYSKLGKTNEALAADRTAIQKDPRSLAGYQSLFLDYMQDRQTNQAWALLEEAGKIKGADAAFLIGLAELYLRVGIEVPAQKSSADQRALAALQRAAKLSPAELRLQMHLADGFNVLGKTAEAARIYEKVIKELPDSSPQYDVVHAKLADIYLHDHDLKRAAAELQVIARNNPTDGQTYYLLGSIEYDQTNYPKAVDYFKNAILCNPDYEPAYYDLASSQLGADKTDDALSTLNRASRKFPQNFTREYLLGVACSRVKDFTNALQHFTTAEVLGENSDPKRLTDAFYFEVGATCERLGDYTRAEKYFKQSLKLAPESPETLNYLGYMWAEHDRNLDQARDLIAKALKAEPKSSAYLDSMAWVLYKLHQPKPALDYELKAMQTSEAEDATLYDHLGDIYTALGQQDKARQAWTKSLSLESNDTIRKKLNSK